MNIKTGETKITVEVVLVYRKYNDVQLYEKKDIDRNLQRNMRKIVNSWGD